MRGEGIDREGGPVDLHETVDRYGKVERGLKCRRRPSAGQRRLHRESAEGT